MQLRVIEDNYATNGAISFLTNNLNVPIGTYLADYEIVFTGSHFIAQVYNLKPHIFANIIPIGEDIEVNYQYTQLKWKLKKQQLRIQYRKTIQLYDISKFIEISSQPSEELDQELSIYYDQYFYNEKQILPQNEIQSDSSKQQISEQQIQMIKIPINQQIKQSMLLQKKNQKNLQISSQNQKKIQQNTFNSIIEKHNNSNKISRSSSEKNNFKLFQDRQFSTKLKRQTIQDVIQQQQQNAHKKTVRRIRSPHPSYVIISENENDEDNDNDIIVGYKQYKCLEKEQEKGVLKRIRVEIERKGTISYGYFRKEASK